MQIIFKDFKQSFFDIRKSTNKMSVILEINHDANGNHT